MNGQMIDPKEIEELIKAKRKAIGVAILVALATASCIALIVATQRLANYDQLKEENKELQSKVSELEETQADYDTVVEQLEYANGQVQLYKESTNALTKQVSGLKAEKEYLNNRIEELLRVKDSVPVITTNRLEEQITALSELVTTKYMYRNATKKESDKTWLWGWTQPFSDVSLLATYDGTITTSVDLKEIKFNVNEHSKTITVKMPASKIFEHNIPQETINVLEVKNNLFNKITFNDYNKFIAAEKVEMEKVAKEQGLLAQADENAKKVLEAFLKTVPGIDAYTLKFN